MTILNSFSKVMDKNVKFMIFTSAICKTYSIFEKYASQVTLHNLSVSHKIVTIVHFIII